jgi:hypothetical protein
MITTVAADVVSTVMMSSMIRIVAAIRSVYVAQHVDRSLLSFASRENDAFFFNKT